jgi:autotransporter-associated beta strand protein
LFGAFTVGSAFVALQVVADTQYSYDQSDPNTYIAIVPHGETNEISSAAVSILNENGVTNFVKRGTGSLISNKDISSYAGGIVIAEGVLRSEPSAKANETVGKLDGGGEIWVLDGATMELYTPSTTLYSTHMDGKTIHIAGRGFNGNGALAVCAGTADGASFGSKIIL